MDINTMSKKVTVTKRQMVLYKMCMFETIDIIQPDQVDYIAFVFKQYNKQNYTDDNPLIYAPYTIHIDG